MTVSIAPSRIVSRPNEDPPRPSYWQKNTRFQVLLLVSRRRTLCLAAVLLVGQRAVGSPPPDMIDEGPMSVWQSGATPLLSGPFPGTIPLRLPPGDCCPFGATQQVRRETFRGRG